MNGYSTYEEICKPSQWTAWSDCDGDCKKDKTGFKTRSRTLESCIIQEDSKICDLSCDDTHEKLQVEDNAECLYTEWGPWDACDNNCVKVRFRKTNHEHCTRVKGTEDCSICVKKPVEPIDAIAEINEIEEAMREDETNLKFKNISAQGLNQGNERLVLNSKLGMKTGNNEEGYLVDDISVSEKDISPFEDEDDDDDKNDSIFNANKDYLDDEAYFSTFDEGLMKKNLGIVPVENKHVNTENNNLRQRGDSPVKQSAFETDNEFWEEFRKFKLLHRSVRSKKPTDVVLGKNPSSQPSTKSSKPPWMEQAEALTVDNDDPSILYSNTEECLSTPWTKCCHGVKFKFKYECFPRIVKEVYFYKIS